MREPEGQALGAVAHDEGLDGVPQQFHTSNLAYRCVVHVLFFVDATYQHDAVFQQMPVLGDGIAGNNRKDGWAVVDAYILVGERPELFFRIAVGHLFDKGGLQFSVDHTSKA